jgi:hypothetical protein
LFTTEGFRGGDGATSNTISISNISGFGKVNIVVSGVFVPTGKTFSVSREYLFQVLRLVEGDNRKNCQSDRQRKSHNCAKNISASPIAVGDWNMLKCVVFDEAVELGLSEL